MVKDRHIVVSGDHIIAGNNLSNVGNVTNITVGASNPLEILESKVASSALLNSAERYPAPHCHPNTRAAARKAVKDWISRKGHGSEQSIMWISGGPGVGKSALLQTVCVWDSALSGDDVSAFVDIEDDNSLIDACYFFGRGMGDREKASFFPATIAYQLVLSRPSCRAIIQGILAKKLSILLESFPSQFQKLVLRTAKAHAAFEAPLTIVIDALDECDNVRDQVTLLDAIFEAATTANMRFVIASRPEQEIQAFFQRTSVSRHTYHIRLDNDFQASRDIEIFLCAKFADIRERKPTLCPRLPNGEEWPGSIIIYRLRDESGGLFIYATLVIAFIDTPYYSPDQQLKALLAAPPARAFSKLDALYRQILTRAPPELPAGCDELRDFHWLVKKILRVVVCWSYSLTPAEIADALDKEVGIVQAIILGPMCSLFKVRSHLCLVTLCHKSLRDFLLDPLRSHDFFVPKDSLDRHYVEVLSREPPRNPLRSYSRKVLMGVLTVVTALGNRLEAPGIASILNASSSVVEAVILGPARAIFSSDLFGYVDFSMCELKDFLLDAGRAEAFFISNHNIDIVFTQILSRQPPSSSPQSYSREFLMGVLKVVAALEGKLIVARIASFLDASPSAVQAVIFGPAKAIFIVEHSPPYVKFSTSIFKAFLLDPDRAGELFVSSDMPDTLFTQVLSRQPPPHTSRSSFREVLMGVLRVVAALEGALDILQIASLLGVAPSAVEDVIFGPTKPIFMVWWCGPYVQFSTPAFKEFLLDAGRAGEFFVSSNMPLDHVFARILSHQLPPTTSQSYSRELLMGVLKVVVALEGRLIVPQIASILDASPSAVQAVIFGPAKAIFIVEHSPSYVKFSFSIFTDFLLDADRAGEFFVSSRDISTLYAQILSCRPPPNHSQSYSREVLMGVLTVVWALEGALSIPQIASFLDAAPSVVNALIFGPAKLLFDVDLFGHVYFSTSLFKDFLLDADRAGEFFMSSRNVDTLFAHILSRQPPPDAPELYSREVLMGVLRVVAERGKPWNASQIADLLGVAPSVAEHVIFGPAKSIFNVDRIGSVRFSTSLFKDFLLDAERAGEFFIGR